MSELRRRPRLRERKVRRGAGGFLQRTRFYPSTRSKTLKYVRVMKRA